MYTLRPGEVEKIKEVNDGYVDVGVKCSCGIHGEKPSFCEQGPLPQTRMGDCGYYFELDGEDFVKKGECKRCGKCCALPRHNGEPYGFYDPAGKSCRHLIVEES